MKKLLLTLLPALILIGCAQSRMESLSAIQGLELSYDKAGNEHIEKYTVVRNLPNHRGSIASCAALKISNKSISLRDGSSNFVNAYPRNYYGVGNNIAVPGGETIKYVDKNAIVVEGIANYDAGGVTRFVRYTALIKPQGNRVSYTFHNIEQAQQDTGVMPNRGFVRVGVWADEDPDKVVATLNNEVEKVQSCLISGR